MSEFIDGKNYFNEASFNEIYEGEKIINTCLILSKQGGLQRL